MNSLLSSIGSSVASSTYRLLARDRNIIIPLEQPNKTKIIKTQDLKKELCEIPKSNLQRVKERKPKTKPKKKKKKRRK